MERGVIEVTEDRNVRQHPAPLDVQRFALGGQGSRAAYLIAMGLIGEPTAPVKFSGAADRKNS